MWKIIYSFAKLERSYQNHSWNSQIIQNKGPVHFRNYILGKFFVWRFYSRHISSWLNYSGEFIVRRFYSSRNNRTPKISGFKKTSQKISNLKSLSSSEKLKKFLDKWKYFMTLHWMIFQVSNMQNSHYQSKYWLCNFHQYW